GSGQADDPGRRRQDLRVPGLEGDAGRQEGRRSPRDLAEDARELQVVRWGKITSMRGVLISVEGVEGSGKSTQCARLAEGLRSRGLEVVLTSEPDGTPLGAGVRTLFETGGVPPTALTQVFLFMAARQQHVSEIIRPALARGAVVISDRYIDATMAYQGF